MRCRWLPKHRSLLLDLKFGRASDSQAAGFRKALSFNYAPGCKVCAEHTLGVVAQVYQGGLNSSLKAANLLSDLSAFLHHVEIGLTLEEVRAARDVDNLVVLT